MNAFVPLTHAQKLFERLTTRIDTVKNIEAQNAEQNINEIRDLKSDLIRDQEIAQEIIEKLNDLQVLTSEDVRKYEERIKVLEKNEVDHVNLIKKLENNVSKQKEQVQLLATNVNKLEIDLQRTNNSFQLLTSSLETAQVAFVFERDLATYVYPNGKKFSYRQIFTTMKKWLEMKKETQQGRKANKKWDDLQKEFSWSDEHEKVFFKLLESRRKFAHPPVNLETVQTQIPDDFNDEEKKRIQDIIGMTEKVNQLMQADLD